MDAINWLLIGCILIFLEALSGGVVLVLLPLGLASFSVAIALTTELITAQDFIAQGVIFTLSCALYSALLWNLLKKIIAPRWACDGGYQDIIGSKALVYGGDIQKGQIGEVKWSGAICKAMLAEEATEDIVSSNTLVYIVETKRNIFIIKKST